LEETVALDPSEMPTYLPDEPRSYDPSHSGGASSGALTGMTAGTVFAGRYRIIKRVGQGGMGEVWLAEQEEPVRREVALKVIKRGMDTAQVVTRFEAERQALAVMDHPAVAKVFDAGSTPDGRPFFVMEYVEGSPMSQFCDEHRMSMRKRLDLFQQVCAGVQHAHQKALIHRDLKPSNVLVALQDGEPVPKIIDFGIAKATRSEMTDETMLTRVGVVVGTPEYMSPEQAMGQHVDTRTDVYSLGVMLYELLVGRLPFESKELLEGGYDSLRKKICEVDPPRPSTRFHSLGEGRNDSAENRKTEPSTLQRELKGDLDWITMKALEKDAARRYSSPAALAQDIEYHLSYRPVLARPPSRRYRSAKFIRRHRWGVALGISVSLALIAGTIGTTVGLLRARQETFKARAVTNHLITMVSEANPEKAQGRQVTVQDALNASNESIGESFAGQPELEMEVRSTMGTLYHELGDYAQAEEHLRRAITLAERELGPHETFTVRVRGKLARTLMDAGRHDDAEREMREVLPIFREHYGDDDLETLQMMHNLAAVYLHQERYELAEPLLLELTALRREALGDDHTDTQSSIGNLAQLYVFTQRFDEAEPLMREGLIVRRRELGNTHPRTLISVFNLGDLYLQDERPAQAEALIVEALEGFREVVGDDHPYTLEALGGWVRVLVGLDRLDEAEAPARESYRLRSERFGAEHSYAIEAKEMLAEVLERTGRSTEANGLN
jgi:serine/threonine protein kinase